MQSTVTEIWHVGRKILEGSRKQDSGRRNQRQKRRSEVWENRIFTLKEKCQDSKTWSRMFKKVEFLMTCFKFFLISNGLKLLYYPKFTLNVCHMHSHHLVVLMKEIIEVMPGDAGTVERYDYVREENMYREITGKCVAEIWRTKHLLCPKKLMGENIGCRWQSNLWITHK